MPRTSRLTKALLVGTLALVGAQVTWGIAQMVYYNSQANKTNAARSFVEAESYRRLAKEARYPSTAGIVATAVGGGATVASAVRDYRRRRRR